MKQQFYGDNPAALRGEMVCESNLVCLDLPSTQKPEDDTAGKQGNLL